MKRLVIAALFLLAWTATASAECAWVLWQESSAVGYAVSWTQSGAWSAASECRSQRAKALSLLGITAQVSEGSAVEVPGSQVRATIRYFCLPDTVDPRGVKGK
jgi:hypothetical protein